MRSTTLLIAALVVCVIPAYCDSKSVARQEIPIELRASDPAIRGLIDAATDKLESDDLEGAFKLAQQAWNLCNSKHLLSDLPVAGLQLSALSISKGEIDVAREFLSKSLEAAAERSNLVLEAQI